MDKNGGKVCIAFTNGCPRSYVGNSLLTEYFVQNNWKLTQRLEDADIVLISGCGVNDAAEKNALYLIGLAKKRIRKDVPLIICGCIVGSTKKQLEEQSNCICLTEETLGYLDTLITASTQIKNIDETNNVQDRLSYSWSVFNKYDRIRAKMASGFNVLPVTKWPLTFILNKLLHNTAIPNQKNAFIRVAVGCPGKCSYCSVVSSMGPLHSKSESKIRKELENNLARGETVFQLVAGDVGAWGSDTGQSFADLLRIFYSYENVFNLMIDDVAPQWLIKNTQEIIGIISKNPKKVNYMSAPVQSGSNGILARMMRPYTKEQVLNTFLKIKTVIPNLSLKTHIIVGFPGESDDDFKDTLDLLHKINFDLIHVFPFSARPNTKAYDFQDRISRSIIKSRMCRLKKEFPATVRLMN